MEAMEALKSRGSGAWVWFGEIPDRSSRARSRTGLHPQYCTIAADLAPGAGFDLTRLSQQQLGMALLRASERASPGAHLDHDRVLHHRTRTRKEIDFVGPGFGGLCIGSKCVDGSWRRDALTLKASPWRGIVATRSELDLAEPGAVAVPAALLAWLIDSQGQ